MTNNNTKDSAALHVSALESLISSDYALAYASEMAIEEPHRLEQVSVDWLESVIAKDTPNAKLLELIDTDAHDGMTDRKKWDLVWNVAGKQAGLPDAIFAKATPHLPAHREMLSVLHMDEAEVKFYEQIRKEVADFTPEPYYQASYGGGRSLVIIEDLVKKGCTPYWQADDCTLEHAKAVIIILAKLHARFWQSERLQTDLTWVRPRTRRYGWPWLYQAHQNVRQVYLDTTTDDILTPRMREALQLWHNNAKAVFDYWDTLPLTVLHGDSHMGNTYSRPDGTAGYFDWQVIFAGHGLRDVAYFLYSALTNEMREEHEASIFDLYLATLAENGVILEHEEAWDNYCIFIFDRWDAAIMSYVHGTYNHAVSGQLRLFKAVDGAIKDHGLIARLEKLLKDEIN